jgi:hypothetical protein
MPKKNLPSYLALTPALKIFVTNLAWQSQAHIKPLHQHFALRLVLEGGFLPEEVTPHPPLRIDAEKGEDVLVFDPDAANEAEQTILGGLKTKSVDVVVTKPNIGPVIGISVKGTLNAFRNLTNRMEEAAGDATNLHLMYPGLVYGFFHVLKANRAGTPKVSVNDVAIGSEGTVVPSIARYHDVLLGLTGRLLVRNELSKYEAVSLAMIDPVAGPHGHLSQSFPPAATVLRAEHFFPALLKRYDLRFPYVAPSMRNLLRCSWSADSPAVTAIGSPDRWISSVGYEPRIAQSD